MPDHASQKRIVWSYPAVTRMTESASCSNVVLDVILDSSSLREGALLDAELPAGATSVSIVVQECSDTRVETVRRVCIVRAHHVGSSRDHQLFLGTSSNLPVTRCARQGPVAAVVSQYAGTRGMGAPHRAPCFIYYE